MRSKYFCTASVRLVRQERSIVGAGGDSRKTAVIGSLPFEE
jgi:hypothetical protein